MRVLLLCLLLSTLSACSSWGANGAIWSDIPIPQPGRKYTVVVKQETITQEKDVQGS